MVISGHGDPKGDNFEVKVADPPAVEGWWIEVFVQGHWQLFKFTTIKKKRNVVKLVNTLKHSYKLKFKYSRGWKMSPQQEPSEETENQFEEGSESRRRHVICGTDCESPCTREWEDGRDWREFQDFTGKDETLEQGQEAEKDGPAGEHYRHNALCGIDCKLDTRPERGPVRGTKSDATEELE